MDKERREEMVQFIAESISEFEGVENTDTLQNEIRKLSNKTLKEKFEFANYLWDK